MKPFMHSTREARVSSRLRPESSTRRRGRAGRIFLEVGNRDCPQNVMWFTLPRGYAVTNMEKSSYFKELQIPTTGLSPNQDHFFTLPRSYATLSEWKRGPINNFGTSAKNDHKMIQKIKKAQTGSQKRIKKWTLKRIWGLGGICRSSKCSLQKNPANCAGGAMTCIWSHTRVQ